MIKPICSMCEKELEDFGAILLGPPSGDICFKFHICKKCWEKIFKLIRVLNPHNKR